MEVRSEVLILAGGFGTRMSSMFPDLPKPLIPVGGMPVLEHQLLECKKYGVTRILILLHHGADQIMEYFGDGAEYNLELTYEVEQEPLGTGGAMLSVLDLMQDTFMVMYADVFSEVNLLDFATTHSHGDSSVTVVAHPNSHPHDSDLLIIDRDQRVLHISAHPHDRTQPIRNMVNAALYIFDKSVLQTLTMCSSTRFDIAQDLLPLLLADNIFVKAYVTLEYLKDMGTPDRLLAVERDIRYGVPQARSTRQKRLAVFFDRDGTLNEEVGYITSPRQIRMLPGASEAVARVNKSKYVAIGTTNQPVVARGDLSVSGLERLLSHMDFELGYGGAYLDKLYYCPHHPDKGYPGEVEELKFKCECRKPAPGMFQQAAKDADIDLFNSWVIGDRTADLRAAETIGARSVLVQTGAAGADLKYPTRPSFVAPDVKSAVNFILDDAPKLEQFFERLVANLDGYRTIFISGLARSGKTTLASNLKWYLKLKGLAPYLIELDRFLKTTRTEENHYSERYDLDAASDLVRRCLSGDSKDFLDYGFDHESNNLICYGADRFQQRPILILEGTVAMTLKQNLNVEGPLIFVETNDACRKRRFVSKYKNRISQDSDLMRLWDRRRLTEDETISGQSDEADYIFSFD